MSASGKKEVMSEAELKQRVIAAQANTTHGGYSFRDRGSDALDAHGRTRLVELREQTQDKTALIALMQEKCADSVLLFEIVQSYVSEQVKLGKPLGEIPSVKVLPAFMNSMQRAIATLINLMPDDRHEANAELIKIQKVIDEHDNKNTK